MNKNIEYVYKRVYILVVTIPIGAGGSFLGYLQRLAQGHVSPVGADDYPYFNYWDGKQGAGHHIYTQHTGDTLPYLKTAQHWTEQLTQGHDYTYGHIARAINSNSYGVDSQGNHSIYWLSHEFPFGLQHHFTRTRWVFALVPDDLDCMIRLQQLKTIKSNRWWSRSAKQRQKLLQNIKQNATHAYLTLEKALNTVKPDSVIRYGDLFDRCDPETIEQFLSTTVGDFDTDKISEIEKMIKIYTEKNNQLIEEYV